MQHNVYDDWVESSKNESNDAGSRIDSSKHRLVGMSFEIKELQTAGENHSEVLVEYNGVEVK